MTELHIAGAIDSALSHLVLVGLAAILEDRTGSRPRIRWTEDWPARPVLSAGMPSDEIFEAVRRHAHAHGEPGCWMSLRVSGGPRNGNGMFTPRATALTTTGQWQDYLSQRRAALDDLMSPGQVAVEHPAAGGFRPLDAAMLVALGESAWWLFGAKSRLPDDGASRWEMKTRNRGEEFIRDRLSHLARAVATRTGNQVGAGLTGAQVTDEAGRNAPNSRSATGLTTPGPTDNALAWCALWGIASAPTIPRAAQDPLSRGMSQTPGTWPRDRTHPTHYAVPVFTTPTTIGRWGAVLTSRSFDEVVRATPSGEVDEAPRRWLAQQGVRAVAVFPTRVVGSAKVSERQLLTGRIHPL